MHFDYYSICLGHKQIKDRYGKLVDYSGEILDGDKATGNGVFTDSLGFKFSGHLVDEMLEGICKEKI